MTRPADTHAMAPAALEETLRELHMRGFILGEDMPAHGGRLTEIARLGYARPRDPILSAGLVALVGADQPERAAEAASAILTAAQAPSRFGHSALYDLTEDGFRFLESSPPPAAPHCGQIRIWTLFCHPGHCACTCAGCSKARGGHER